VAALAPAFQMATPNYRFDGAAAAFHAAGAVFASATAAVRYNTA
jgi:hypothetical protein